MQRGAAADDSASEQRSLELPGEIGEPKDATEAKPNDSGPQQDRGSPGGTLHCPTPLPKTQQTQQGALTGPSGAAGGLLVQMHPEQGLLEVTTEPPGSR